MIQKMTLRTRRNITIVPAVFCLLLLAGTTAARPDLRLKANQKEPFYAGDNMIVSLTATNSGETPCVDLYIAVEALGRLFFYPGFGSSAVSFASKATLPNPLEVTFDIISMEIPEEFPGCLKWTAAFTEAGTVQILAIDQIMTLIIPREFPGVEMTLVPAGSFWMGSPKKEYCRDNDETSHEVTLTKSFLMQNTETTQYQWMTVMKANPSQFDDCGWDCPVEHVSWHDCMTYCNRLSQEEGYTPCYYSDSSFAEVFDDSEGDVYWNRGADGYRLPTEAEWEYAARATTSGPYAFDCDDYTAFNCNSCEPECLDEFAWYCGNSDAACAVGGLSANGFGLFDTHGNVWEWCWDIWDGDYEIGSAVDPTGPLEGAYRVYRGGSWFDEANFCRSANRNAFQPTYKASHLGFRPVRSP